MKIKKILFLTLLASTFSCQNGNEEGAYAKKKSIVIFYDNDVHCNIDGYVSFAGIRDAVAKMDTAYVLTVSSGDYVQGGTPGVLSKGEYPIRLMNSVGYDAVTLGNHEFDYKIPRLFELTKMLQSQITCVNFTEEGKSEPIYKPYVIKTCGKKKVAFVGIVTPETLTAEYYAFYEGNKKIYDLHTDELINMTQEAVNNARKEGADYVVLLSHVGEKSEFNVMKLIAGTNGIDIVLDGHSHSVIESNFATNKDGKKVCYTQTGTEMANYGKLLISKDGKFTTTLIPAKEITEKSSKVQATLDSVKVLYNEIANQKLGHTNVLLTINDQNGKRAIRNTETNIGDFVADAYRYVGNAEIGLVNGGGVRTDIKIGDITYKDVINVSPFCNAIDVISCKGKYIIGVIESTYQSLPNEEGSFMQIAGIKLEVNITPNGNKVDKVKVLNRQTEQYEPIDPEKLYSVAMTSYVIDLKKDIIKEYTTLKSNIMTDNEAIKKYLEEGLKGTIDQEYSQPQGRIKINK